MKRLLFVILVAAVIAPTVAAQAAGQQDQGDRTLSPYFFVKSDNPDVDQLPLASSSASVDIAGVIASVRLTQVYKNTGRRPIEAVYIFPGSTRAAVHGMTMTVGERRIVAKIEERQEARRQYEAARNAGQTASLLEQQRPNVFQMNVANILPGDSITVELFYTELLVPHDQVYEFVFPTVVGPRYTNRSAEGAAAAKAWVRNPYLRQGEVPTSTFGFRADIAAGMPLRDVGSPSHDVKIDYVDQQRARISLQGADASNADNRDVVLRYRLADDRIETGVLLGASGDERFFLCLVEPPRRFTPAAIPPREYVFIVDVSGSMSGFPLETSKELLRNLLAALRPTDSFNVLFFAGGSYVLSPSSLPATEANRTMAIREVARQQGGGGTELLPALTRAFNLPRSRPGLSRTVIVATDGYVDVERDAFTLIRDHLGDANVFAFGIGSSVNRHLIEGLARIGEGEPFVVLNPGEASGAAARFLEYVKSPLLTHVEVRTPGLQSYDLEPARTPDLFASRPLVITGKYRGEATGEIVVTGFTGEGRFERHIPVDPAGQASRPVGQASRPEGQASRPEGQASRLPSGEALKYLWARQRVAVLSDFRTASGGADEDNRRQITDLGLKYNLLTEFTSFVAIDQRVRRTDGSWETVKQPLPLPQGVSDAAVGGVAGGTGGGVSRMVAAESVALALPSSRNMAAKSSAPMPQAAPVQAPADARKEDKLQQNPSVRVRVLETHLAGPRTAARPLEELLSAALSVVDPAASAALSRGARKARVTFDAAGRVVRVELLEPLKPGDPSDLAGLLQRALQRAAVSSGRGGYVIVTVG
jgi:Ca-activated chloride channel homolog